jgi:hypothetical protein
MLEPLRIDKMPFDHLRQLWLSAKENQRSGKMMTFLVCLMPVY